MHPIQLHPQSVSVAEFLVLHVPVASLHNNVVSLQPQSALGDPLPNHWILGLRYVCLLVSCLYLLCLFCLSSALCLLYRFLVMVCFLCSLHVSGAVFSCSLLPSPSLLFLRLIVFVLFCLWLLFGLLCWFLPWFLIIFCFVLFICFLHLCFFIVVLMICVCVCEAQVCPVCSLVPAPLCSLSICSITAPRHAMVTVHKVPLVATKRTLLLLLCGSACFFGTPRPGKAARSLAKPMATPDANTLQSRWDAARKSARQANHSKVELICCHCHSRTCAGSA